MITNIFNKNYLLELDADLQTHIKSFIPKNLLKIIFLNDHIPNIKKKNKRFYNKVVKSFILISFDIRNDIKKYIYNEVPFIFLETEYNLDYVSANELIEYIERCIIVRYFDLVFSFEYPGLAILQNKLYNNIIIYFKHISNSNLKGITSYKKKKIYKLIDIFNEENLDPFFYI